MTPEETLTAGVRMWLDNHPFTFAFMSIYLVSDRGIVDIICLLLIMAGIHYGW